MREKLKPCPWCGSEPTIEEYEEGAFEVACPNHKWTPYGEDGIQYAADVRLYAEARGEYDVVERRTVYTSEERKLAEEKAIEQWNSWADGWADSAKVRDRIAGIADGLHGKAKKNYMMMPKQMLYFADKLEEVVNR